MDCLGTYLIMTHAQTCDHVRVQSATEWTASVHTWSWHMPKPVTTFVLKVLRNGLPRYILTCPNMWSRSCAKCYGMDCPGTYFMWHTCRNLWSRSFSRCCGTDCLVTYLTHAETCDSKCYGMDCLGTYLIMTHAQTCDHIRAQSATEWTAPVHTWHMPKHVITFVFKVLRNGLPRYILDHDTCPNLWPHSCSKCYGMDCPGTYLMWHTCRNLWLRSFSRCCGTDCLVTYLTHAETCDHVRVQCGRIPKPVITFVLKALRNGLPGVHIWQPVITLVPKVLRYGLLRYILQTCPNLCSCSFSNFHWTDCLGTYLMHAQSRAHLPVQSATEWAAPVHTDTCPKPVSTFVFNATAWTANSWHAQAVTPFVLKSPYGIDQLLR